MIISGSTAHWVNTARIQAFIHTGATQTMKEHAHKFLEHKGLQQMANIASLKNNQKNLQTWLYNSPIPRWPLYDLLFPGHPKYIFVCLLRISPGVVRVRRL